MIGRLQSVRTYISLIAVLGLIIFDSRYRFDPAFVSAKWQNRSDQRGWSLFYPQRYVYEHGGLRYDADMKKIEALISSNRTLLSDRATSYYAASMLPVYVVNVHRHQGRNSRSSAARFLDARIACYIEEEENRQKFISFLQQQQKLAESRPWLAIEYVLLNRDASNKNLSTDCLASRQRVIASELTQIGEQLYQGEYLDLYKLD